MKNYWDGFYWMLLLIGCMILPPVLYEITEQDDPERIDNPSADWCERMKLFDRDCCARDNALNLKLKNEKGD